MDMIRLFSSSFCLFSLLLPLCFNSATSSIPENENDRAALLEFKAKITHDPLGVMSSWNNSIHFCQWNGVTCGRRHQRVTVLDLASHKLAGLISPYIGNLSFLRELRLYNNSLSSELPPEVGRLRRLQMLHLHNNSLVGIIPSNLTSCTNLISIRLEINRLVGKIPMNIGSLRKLEVLSLFRNNLIGEIPSLVGNLSSLVILDIRSNRLSGSIPYAIGQLKNLTFIGLFNNSFSGTIPPSIFNLSSLLTFDVAINQLHGNLPSNLGTVFPSIQYFSIADNEFTGSIPPSISNSSNLVYLLLLSNNLIGEVPNLKNLHELRWLNLASNNLGSGEVDDLSFLSSLTNVTSLEHLFISLNNFGGVLPESVSNLSSRLVELGLERNQIVGKIPTAIGNLKSLEVFAASDNQLSFSIPESIGELRRLQLLYLGHNEVTGNIPFSLGNLEMLTELRLEGNKLQGSIPSSLGNCQKLLILDISSNNISGTIPPEVISISSLSIFVDLSHNQLSGTLPVEVGKLKNLGVLNVSNNMLSGEIPSSLGSCVSLEVLSIQSNLFNGTIPSTFSSLKGIVSLDISNNNLSGEILEFLEGLVLLENLNLSFNDFVGMVPSKGVFGNASATSVEGNNKLCGGISEFHLPVCNFHGPANGRRLTRQLKIIISTLLAIVGALVVITFLFFCWLRKKSKGIASTSSKNSLIQVSYHTLFNATEGFSSTNLIGAGSFGTVYKGTLNDDERVVAIKVFNLQRRGASRSFITECEALRNIRHRNLVKVITACSSIDIHGNDFKALVYEFMVNGNLGEWLHPTELEDPRESTRMLDLLQRINITIDVACALDYLHHQYCQTTIVHCDLKPSNVLLDEEMTACVADFGLAKFLSEGTDNSTAGQSSSIGVRGTVGYAAPEYGMGSEVSTYGDMYSFGILLLEMFSGKKPIDSMFNDNLNLHEYVKMALPEQVAEITDPMLLEGREEDERGSDKNDKVIESLVLIFEIGLACSEDMPRERMDSSRAAAKLLAVRDNLTGN